jgi:hypothetical protein
MLFDLVRKKKMLGDQCDPKLFTVGYDLIDLGLSVKESEECAERAISLRRHWGTFRNSSQTGIYCIGHPVFKTMGRTRTLRDSYGVVRMNLLLKKHFNALLERTKRVLEERYSKSVFCYPKSSLPGIYLFTKNTLNRGGKIHIDLQFSALPKWRGIGSIQHAFAFTVPLRIPRSGTGLEIWLQSDQQFYESHRIGVWNSNDFGQAVQVPYQLGSMVIIEGMALHRIAPTIIEPDEIRITHQGHGVIDQSGVHLFW